MNEHYPHEFAALEIAFAAFETTERSTAGALIFLNKLSDHDFFSMNTKEFSRVT
ncbi:MAG: hypothetical protein ACR2OV_11445 [Hyphomicrobiaceae bacterium]